MKFLLAAQFLLCLCSFGFDALRRGEEPFRGTVKPHVPGFYILRLDGSRDISFDRELFCKEIPLPGKQPRTIQWILTERNFSRIPGKYRKTFPFEEKFVQSKGFGFPATLSPETGKRMTILHFEPDFEERHSFAFRITADCRAGFYLNGMLIAEIPAKEPFLIRIPWWEMRSLPSRAVLVLPENGSAVMETTRLHGVRFLENIPPHPANPDWPRAVLSSGERKVEIALPDPGKGFYRGCRFQSAGMITAFPGFTSNVPPEVHDPRNHDDAAGQAEEFIEVPDYDSPGNLFLKIGVGLLRKRGSSYFHQKNYRVVQFFPWETELHADRAVFRQSGSAPSGFAYFLEKEISLSEAVLTIRYRLKNTGKHPFSTREYAHNFLSPATIVYPDAVFSPGKKAEAFPLKTTRHGTAVAKGKTILHISESEGWELGRALFRSERVISPEFFRKVTLAPGEKAEWERNYTVLNMEPNQKGEKNVQSRNCRLRRNRPGTCEFMECDRRSKRCRGGGSECGTGKKRRGTLRSRSSDESSGSAGRP